MSLVLYGHPFSSYTQKALVALYENATPFDFRCIEPQYAQHVKEWQQAWPFGKFPVLVDGDRTVAESSILIEYLQLHHPGLVRLVPQDPEQALEVRFMDCFFDLHVMAAAQHAVDGALTGDTARREEGLAMSRKKLEVAYAWLQGRLGERAWSAGEAFSMADCAAAPFLFYADWVHPIGDAYPAVRRLRARLLARPSMVRAVNEARPFRHYFPLGAPERD